MMNDSLPALSSAELAQVTGGNIGAIGQRIGGLVDRFTGGSGRGAQIGGQIGGLIQSFLGRRGGGEGGGGAPGGGGPGGGGPGEETSVRVTQG